MKNIVRLSENDLVRLVNKVLSEQSEVDKLVSNYDKAKKKNMIAKCASMGVKSPGNCDTVGKKPVETCAKLGVKSPGYCYVDTKKPIPEMNNTK